MSQTLGVKSMIVGLFGEFDWMCRVSGRNKLSSSVLANGLSPVAHVGTAKKAGTLTLAFRDLKFKTLLI